MAKRKGELTTKKRSEYRKICGERDGWFCKKCGIPLIPEDEPIQEGIYYEKSIGETFCVKQGFARPTLDHIIPLSIENITDISNFQLLCHSCNRKRRTISWAQFLEQ